MYKIVILLFVYFAFPLVIIYMTRRWSLFRKIGSIALAYAFGLIFGTSGILPQGSEAYRFALQGELSLTKAEMETLLSKGTVSKDDLFINTIAVIQENLLNVTVLLAFPLLLFSLNFRKWLKFAKEGLISMILALVSILAIIASGYFIFRDVVPDSWKVAGMLVGVYTGGTPNMASLKVALDVDPSLFLMTSTYDIIVGAATLIFFITAGPRVFRAFLPPFKREGININTDEAVAEAEGFEDFSGMFGKERVLPLLKALGISLLILALSVGLSLLAPKEFENVIVILSVTTLAVMAAFIYSRDFKKKASCLLKQIIQSHIEPHSAILLIECFSKVYSYNKIFIHNYPETCASSNMQFFCFRFEEFSGNEFSFSLNINIRCVEFYFIGD